MFKKLTAAAFTAAMMVSLPVMAKDSLFKIYHDDEHTDTVTRPTYYVIGVTTPDAQAWVNGEEAHVYKTGSFGGQVTLKPGLNKIPVKVTVKKKSEKKTVEIYYNDAPRKVAPRQSEPSTMALAQPVNIKTLPGAYFQYGNGGDRLGGSKIGFVDAGIEMTAVGETRNLYKVQLSDNRYTYLPKEYAEVGGEGKTTVNTGSWSLSNNGKADRISISLPVKLPYTSRTEIDPSTIKVSLYGATCNSNWITQRGQLGMIEFVDFEQEESDVLTLTIRLKEKYQWGYTISYSGSTLNIDVRHCPASLDLKDLTIGLDAGHGGPYPGAYSPSGLKEKDVNLDIVLKAADILRKKGANVVLTRDGDTGPSMTERKQIWREGNVDLAISVHNNASGNPLIPMGTSAYYKHIFDRQLAASLHQSMLSLGLANFGLTGNFNFSLNGPTDYPNALVEVLFMSSLPEEELLADPEYRGKLAAKIVEGLENYLKMVKASK
ncbi:MAG: N-acetylmuramoyl-L-alanine amidase [Muribaculaceae bacterium]|nr:N-acetylmuramoyl-L-alanine amidase [Muribaculaceae bacterium]